MANGIEVTENGNIVITGEGIEIYRLLALRGALKLEVLGMKGRVNAFKMVKELTGLKGTKAAVLAAYENLLREAGILSN